jgi:hypothetical protein
MAKTYNTISTFTSGQVLTAAQMNEIGTNSNNYRVPPAVRVKLTGNKTITSDVGIPWDAEDYDTDAMWTSGANVTINTAGIYLFTLKGRVTLSVAQNSVDVRIIRNSTDTLIQWNSAGVAAPPTTDFRFGSSIVAACSATDTVVAAVQTGSTITADGVSIPVVLTATWLGQTS